MSSRNLAFLSVLLLSLALAFILSLPMALVPPGTADLPRRKQGEGKAEGFPLTGLLSFNLERKVQISITVSQVGSPPAITETARSCL